MRLYCTAIFFIFGVSEALACTAGGVPCDQVFREQLQGIDQHRMENARRQEYIEQQQHQDNLARIRRERELQEARGSVSNRRVPSIETQTVTVPPRSGGNDSAECRAYPTMCSAYK